MTLRWAWGLAAALWFAPTYAGARPEIHVLIAAEGAWPEGVEKTLREVSSLLKQSDLVLLAIPPQTPPLPDADIWLEKAELGLEQLDLDAATEAHTKALEALSLSAKLTRPMSELFLSRALLFYAQGNNPAAQKELAAAAVIEPSLTPDPIRYPPKLLKLYKSALQEIKKRPSAKVEVTAPKDATIWVDGALYKASRSLPVGTHYLRVEGAGCLPFVQKFTLTSSGARLTATLKEDLFKQDQALRALAAQNPSAPLGWAQEQGLYNLLVLAPGPSGWLLSRFNVKERTALGQLNTSAARLKSDLLLLLEPADALSLELPKEPTPTTPRWRSPVLWLPVGLGLVGGAVLLSFDLLDEQSGARPTIDLRGRP